MTASFKLPPVLNHLSSMAGTQWSHVAKEKGPHLISGIALLLLAWQAAKLTWLFIIPATVVDEPMPPPTLPVPSYSQVDPQQIANAHLFGNVAANLALTDPNTLPISQLNLLLAGTMAMPKPEEGFAIVGETATNAKFYRVGSTINGNARLHAVYSGLIVIENAGKLEAVKLPRGLPSTMSLPVSKPVVSNAPGDNLRRLVSNNPNVLGDLFRAQPVLANGVQKGYRIYPGRDREQFTRMGLQSGDLVTSVNGTALDDIRRGSEVLNSLTSATTAQITIERNGVSQSLVLDMSQLNLSQTTSAQSSSDKSASSDTGPRSGGLSGLPATNSAKTK